MEPCPSISKCPFFNETLIEKPFLAGIYKTNYCEGQFELCARYKVSLEIGSSNVPLELFPNQIELVDEIIQEVR